MDNNSLTHYGIPGMRWGVRRSKAQLRRARGPNPGPRKVSKEVYEAEKAKAINSGDVKKVKAWQNKLTTQELKQAIERCKLTTELSSMSNSGLKTAKGYVDSAVKGVAGATKVVGTGLAAYATTAKINNTFNKKRIPEINGTYYKNQTK